MAQRHPKGRIFTEALQRQLFQIHKLMDTMNDDEIDATLRDLEALNEGNCGWLLFQSRDFLRSRLVHVRAEHARVRDSARAAAGMKVSK